MLEISAKIGILGRFCSQTSSSMLEEKQECKAKKIAQIIRRKGLKKLFWCMWLLYNGRAPSSRTLSPMCFEGSTPDATTTGWWRQICISSTAALLCSDSHLGIIHSASFLAIIAWSGVQGKYMPLQIQWRMISKEQTTPLPFAIHTSSKYYVASKFGDANSNVAGRVRTDSDGAQPLGYAILRRAPPVALWISFFFFFKLFFLIRVIMASLHIPLRTAGWNTQSSQPATPCDECHSILLVRCFSVACPDVVAMMLQENGILDKIWITPLNLGLSAPAERASSFFMDAAIQVLLDTSCPAASTRSKDWRHGMLPLLMYTEERRI